MGGPGLYRWRVRVATDSPLFPFGPWVSLADNARNEADIRLTDGVLDVGAPPPTARGLRVASAQPSHGAVRLAFGLAERSAISLEIFDVSGRRVRTLVNGSPFAPGEHVVAWDGRTDAGGRAPRGCYFARLAHGAAREVARIIRLD